MGESDSKWPAYVIRPKTRTFLLDQQGMDQLRALSSRRGRCMQSSEREEKTVTVVNRRETMQLPRSGSRLRKQSSMLSMVSSVSMESPGSSVMSSPRPSSSCNCDQGASYYTCTCDLTSSPYEYSSGVSRISYPYTPTPQPKLNSSTQKSNNLSSITCSRYRSKPSLGLSKSAELLTCPDSPLDEPQSPVSWTSENTSNSGIPDIQVNNGDTSTQDNPAEDTFVKDNHEQGHSKHDNSPPLPSTPSSGKKTHKDKSSTLPRSKKDPSSSLPRSKSSPFGRKSWTNSLPRPIQSGTLMLPPSRSSKVVLNVLSFLFGCNSKNSSNVNVQIKDEIAEVTQEMDGLDLADSLGNLGVHDGKQNPKSTTLLVGKKKFNMDPKKGLEYLIENELLSNTPEDISEFLFKGEGLSKRAIGDYLGERNDFNIAVLKAFVNLHEFSDMLIVQALRQFLWSFRLPGEAQKIDRMMECFAQRYCDLNPQHFSTTDTCYVLSFATIMLNTSLHNPAVKDKPSVERFIDMNRGINDGKDLPAELLTRVFDNIKKEPFKIPEDDGDDLIHTFFNPDKEGWLWKQGRTKMSGRYKTWKRRWFLLKDHCLYYFEFTQDKEPKGIIPLENIQIREANDRDKPNCFELYAVNQDFIKACKTNSDGKVVEGKHQVYRMSAASPDEKDQWMRTIKQSIKSDTPFYSILAARRKKAQHEK